MSTVREELFSDLYRVLTVEITHGHRNNPVSSIL